jgi:outer membrane receptor protein involved in Fe transport
VATDVVRNSSGQIACRNPANNCAPINLFGPEGSISPEAFAFMNVSTTGSVNASLAQARGLVSGDFGATLPWAEEPIGVAVGVEYRNYSASTASDAATQTPAEVLGSGAAVIDVAGGYKVYEAFGELVFPIVANRPLFHSLTLELGGRVSDYSTSGTSYTYKAGLSWEPVPSLKLRANYNRAARSPNIAELYTPLTTALTNLATDPCQGASPVGNAALAAICIAQGAPAGTIGSIPAPSAAQANFTSGGNLNLDVEKATTWTIGAVFQPDFIPGFSASIDYYNITIKDAITAPGVDDALSACFGPAPYTSPAAGAAATPACTRIRRSPLSGGLSGSNATTPGLALDLSNQGLLTTSGIDVSLAYRRDLGFAGLNLSFNGNWTDSLKFRATPVSLNRECVGFYSVNCSPGSFVASPGSIVPEFSFNQRTTLSFGETDVSLLWRYIHSVDAEPGTGPWLAEFAHIPAHHYFDLAIRQEVMDNFTFTFTVQNLLDKQPPIVGNTIGTTSFGSGNTYPSTYDALGRRFAVGATLRF